MAEVQAGQVWADNDPRAAGRTIKVLTIVGDKALCRVETDSENAARSMVGHRTRILLRRFVPSRSGYVLKKES